MTKSRTIRTVELASVLQRIRNGLSVRQSKTADGLPISRIETISDGTVDPRRVGYAGIQPGDRDEWLLRNGDILLSHINSLEHLGKCAIYENTPPQLIHGMNLLGLRPSTDTVLPRYLLYALRSSAFRDQLPRIINKSVNQVSVSITSLSTLRIPLPPLSEQKRIADILDKADAIRRKRQEAIQLTEQFLRSAFLDIFGDPVSNSRNWPTVSLKKYGIVTTGNTPSRKIPENYGTAIEWIKSDNINTPFHYLTRATEGLSQIGKKLARTVEAGATLVTCIAGSRDCVGNAAMTDRTVAFNQQINAVTPSPIADPCFLYTLIHLSKRLVQRSSTESMKGMVSKGKFEQVQVIDVPPKDQREFGQVFKRILATLDNQHATATESDDLFNSLVQRAFRGEL